MQADQRLLEGQVALVTGAGRGLGRAFAATLARLGCSVCLHGMREHGPAEFGEGTTLTETAREVGAQYNVATHPVLGDLTQMDHVERVVGTVVDHLGPIDILVHNAGGDIAAAGGKPEPNDAVFIPEIDVRAMIDRNLLATVFVCQVVARQMMQRRRGRIVTISSIGAYGGRPDGVIYAAAKAGAIQYTRGLAAQLRPYNVTANSIAPGGTRTARFLATREVDSARLVEGGTLERVALVDEVARAVEVFAGPTGDFITGQVLRVDGGSQCWPA
ncbi:MAG TPA: SDR family oxidoreductase [Acetobacteraceae bacterium]|jgi:3-oxoacyl-[acyl-carrier protein] reductase